MTVTLERFANDSAAGELSANIDASTTSVALKTGHGSRFPASGIYRVRVDDEIMRVDSRSGDTFTVERGIEGTTAATHSANAEVAAVLTAGAMERWLPDYALQPRHNKMLGWNYPPQLLAPSANNALVAGRPEFFKVPWPEDMTIANVHVFVGSAGATVANGRAGVYKADGTLICQTAAAITTAWESTGVKTHAQVAEASQSLDQPGGPDTFLVVALLVGSAGTQPQFARTHSGTGLANAGLTAGTDLLWVAIDQTTGQTTLPATKDFLSAAIGSDNPMIWVGIS